MLRVKFSFAESSHDTLYKLAIEKGVTAAEIVRRALSLYDSCNRELKSKDKLIITKEYLQ